MQSDAMSGDFPAGRPAPIGAAGKAKSAARGLSVGRRLTLIVLAVSTPMLLLAALVVWWLANHQSQERREVMLYASRVIQSAVDAQLRKYITIGQVLAASPSLQSDDLAAFREEAEHTLPGLSRYWVVLADAHGRQVVNTFAPRARAFPPLAPQLFANEVRAFETKRLQISGVLTGPIAKIPFIVVGVPVFHKGKPVYDVMIGVDVTVFRHLLNVQRVPKGWLPAVIDRQGNFIARTHHGGRRIGEPAPAGWRAVMQLDGVFEFPSLQGRPSTHANTVSPLSGWAIGVAVPNDVFEAPIRQTVLIASLVGLAVTLLSMLLAAWAARRITIPIKALESGARALQRREPVSFVATQVPEFDHALHAFDSASQALLEHEHQQTRAQMALRASEEQLRLLIDGTKDYAVFMLDPKGNVVSWNEGARRAEGYAADEIIGRHFFVFHTSEDIAAGKPNDELETALRAGAYEEEGERVKKDGTRFWASVVITPLFDENGKLKGFSNITRDITARKRAQEKLAWLASFPERISDPIVEIDLAGRIHYLNPTAERLFPDLAQKGLAHAWLADWQSVLPRVQQTDKYERFVVVGESTYQQSIYYLEDVERLRIYGSDITDRKRAEEKFAALTDRLRATVDTAADAIVVIDQCGIVQSVNPAVERMFGYCADEVVGRNVSMLMPEPYRSAHDDYLEAYLWTGVAKIIGIGREVEGQRKDGRIFPIELAVAEWRIADKRFFTGILRDITDRKQAEEHVRFVMRELSHRTKNVLAVVQSMAWQTARSSVDLEDFGKRFASRVEALACSHDLLTETRWQGVRLDDLVRGQLRLFGAEKHLDADGPELVLKPEAAQSLGLALHELATNALKYGALTRPTGRIEISWSIEADDAASGQFRMVWRESGGPEAGPPERTGFGRTVIKEMTERALKGHVALEFRSEGLFWQFTGPVVACLANAADLTP